MADAPNTEGVTPESAPTGAPEGAAPGTPPGDAAAAVAAPTEPAPVSGGPPVTLRNRYQLQPDTPLPELSTPSAEAYHVADTKEPNRALFALICQPAMPVRVNAMSAFKGNILKGILPLVEWDTVFWPPFNRKTMVIVYERPRGGRASEQFTEANPVSEYELASRIMMPLTAAMQELNSVGVTHRSIRPDNMYFMDAAKQDLVLGDCVCVPPGFDQPHIYEPIDRALADPAGRGPGEAKDDIYALGVSLLYLLTGRPPASHLKAGAIMDGKMEHDTYTTLTGKERVPLHLLEPLRGMLSDDIEQRWGIEELDLWVNGRQMSPLQRKPPKKAEAAFRFNKYDHICGGTLARHLLAMPTEGIKVLKSADFAKWLRRGLGAEIAEAVQTAIDVSTANAGSPLGSDDYLIAKVAMLLHPGAPLRYKNVSYMPEGFGAIMVHEYMTKGNAQVCAETVSLDLFGIWKNAQGEYAPDLSALERNFGQLKVILGNNNSGYGIERCIYELNPAFPCQSALVLSDYVARIEELLPALEKIADNADQRSKPMDRHIAAFTAARFRQDVEPHLAALSSDDEAKSVIGMLSLLAAVQWRQNLRELKGLASWFGALLGPVIGSYHSKTTRRMLEKDIPSVIRKGDLAELFGMIDNPEQRQEDIEGFTIARYAFAKAEEEVAEIESSDVAESASAIRMGQQAAAMASVLLMLIAIVVTFMMESY